MRLMSARSNVQFRQTPIAESSAVEDFLSKLTTSAHDRIFLCELRFVAQPQLRSFCAVDLKVLMRVVARAFVPEPSIVRGGIKGHISWDRTSRLRAGGRLDAASYAVSIRKRSVDLPENQLIKLFLNTISKLLQSVLRQSKSGDLGKSLLSLKLEVDGMLRQSWLREVQTRQVSSVIMRSRALRSRDWRYGEIARFQADYEHIFSESKWVAILTLLQKGWLEPVDDDDLFELYTLFIVLDIISLELGFGDPRSWGIISPGRREVASFRRASDGMLVNVFFDQSPKQIFKIESEYTSLGAKYEDISFNPRRPDITLEFVAATGHVHRLLIECKDTVDDGYQRDSVYKCFGYLYDLREVWGSSNRQPKILVVFPGSVRPKSDLSSSDQLVLTSVADRPRLSRALAQCLTF